mmetsp:Transcript_50005/g.83289  ORF Transcript_50005/g.83289 Transcript_50005/m.83289 type:complete len:81 (+) Transcript_50005:145-387(+)
MDGASVGDIDEVSAKERKRVPASVPVDTKHKNNKQATLPKSVNREGIIVRAECQNRDKKIRDRKNATQRLNEKDRKRTIK